MNSEEALAQLSDQVGEWVTRLMPADIPRTPLPRATETKVIREAVTGYQVLQPHEYLVLDSPPLQRLRYIRQTALAYLVYPTANHTRFDHSLGCAKIAQQLGEKVVHRNKTYVMELRLAALLHDVGHTFFSHLSESIMQSRFRGIYRLAKRAPRFRGRDPGLGEIVSYLIVKSDRFSSFLDRVVHHYRDCSKVDLNKVAELIVHVPADELAYMADIISGPFDADKLDYLVRDCAFCGIRADVDVERLLVSARLLDRRRFRSTDPKWRERYLVLNSGGVSILEQITFNRMLLYPAMYHHHKVRAIECMVRSLFEMIWEYPDRITDSRLKFDRIIDFYALTDYEFLSLAAEEPALQPAVQRLTSRDLLERCLVISKRYLTQSVGFLDLYKRSTEDYPDQLRALREEIVQEMPAGKRCSVHDLWVDVPKPPTSIAKDPDRAWIDIGTKEMLRLRDFFPYPAWVTSYEANKWKGHVFGTWEPEVRRTANRAAKSRFLQKPYQLRFDRRATDECKLPN